MVQVVTPEDFGGGDLNLLPEGSFDGELKDLFVGESKAGNAKLTVRWELTSEYEGKKTALKEFDLKTCVGEMVLDQYSLLPQSLWRLNNLYRDVTGEDLPKGQEWTGEEFQDFLKEALVGCEAKLSIVTDDGSGEERSNVDAISVQ